MNKLSRKEIRKRKYLGYYPLNPFEYVVVLIMLAIKHKFHRKENV